MLTTDAMTRLALLGNTSLIAGLFALLCNRRREYYLRLWAAGWGLLALRYLIPALEPSFETSPAVRATDQWLLAVSGLLFFLGAQLYSQHRPRLGHATAAAIALAAW